MTSDLPDIAPENSGGGGRLEQSLGGGGPELLLRTTGDPVRIRQSLDQP